MGGGRDASANFPNRPLSEIELKLVSRVTDLAIQALENAWDNLCQLKLRVVQVESNPQLVQIVPPNEVIVLISFEITMGEVRGIMNICIPFNTIEPLAGKLSTDTWSAYRKRSADARQRLNLETGVSQAPIEMTVTLAHTKLTADEVAHLAVGDVIVTETATEQGIEVLIAGLPAFRAHPGLLKGHKAVQIGLPIVGKRDLIENKLQTLTAESGDDEPTR